MNFTLAQTSEDLLCPTSSSFTVQINPSGPCGPQLLTGGLSGRQGAVVPNPGGSAGERPGEAFHWCADVLEGQEAVLIGCAPTEGEDEGVNVWSQLESLVQRASATGLPVADTMKAGFEVMRKSFLIRSDSTIRSMFTDAEEEALTEKFSALNECETAKQALAILTRAAGRFLSFFALTKKEPKFSGMAFTWNEVRLLEGLRGEVLADSGQWIGILQVYAAAHARHLQACSADDPGYGFELRDVPMDDVQYDGAWGKGTRECQINWSRELRTTTTSLGSVLYWSELLLNNAYAVPVVIMTTSEWRCLLNEAEDGVATLTSVRNAIHSQTRTRLEREQNERLVLASYEMDLSLCQLPHQVPH